MSRARPPEAAHAGPNSAQREGAAVSATLVSIARRHAVAMVAGAVLLGATAGATAQSTWPSKPIRIITPFPASGQLDQVVRLVAAKIGPALGQPIIIDNRTGADGLIGTQAAARSAGDGYTWLATAIPYTTLAALRPRDLGYDPRRDFKPVILLGTSTFALVVPNSLPVKTLQEFVAYAKARPGELSYAGATTGSMPHLSAEMFLREAGIKVMRVPYAGIPPALSDLVTGRTQFMSIGMSTALPLIKGGQLRPLAVLDPQRNPLLPDVPTIREAGYPELNLTTWFGMLVPAQTPDEIVTRINREIAKALRDPEVLAKYRSIGVDVVEDLTPEAFANHIRHELDRWARVVKEADIKLD